MQDLELPLGERTQFYRFLELLPAIITFGLIGGVVLLSFTDPVVASYLLLGLTLMLLFRAVRASLDVMVGGLRLQRAKTTNWRKKLDQLQSSSKLDLKPTELIHAIIIATYKEPFEILASTVRSLLESNTDKSQLAILIAYEERGGAQTEENVTRLKELYGPDFARFELVKHPANLKNEVPGKGGNISYAGRYLKQLMLSEKIDLNRVLVTTLDADNRPHRDYFNLVSYKYLNSPNRHQLAFQPISLFHNNIWQAPAPMRVIASTNSIWNVVTSVRKYALRNFASHTQPLSALSEMNFWSTRTVVEDGHQYWRSYFHFDGNYRVVPIHLPNYQDAVLAESYSASLKAQYVQLSRWSYGVSDFPYVANLLFSENRKVKFWPTFWRMLVMLESHISMAGLTLTMFFGTMLSNWTLSRQGLENIALENFRDATTGFTWMFTLSTAVTIVAFFILLPKRPADYPITKYFGMAAQWVLLPLTLIFYSASSAMYSQIRLFTGNYNESFAVTAKAATFTQSKTGTFNRLVANTSPIAIRSE